MKWFLNLFFLLFFSVQSFANDYIDVNFTNLKLDEFIKIVSKVSNKNILVSEPLDINLNFVSNKKIKKDDLLTILKTILDEHNYVLEQKGDFLKISKKIPPKKENSISKVYELRNIDAENIAKILENIIEKNSYEEGEKPNISFSQETNSIVLTGQKDILEPLFNLLKDLDKQKEQVYIQAKIIEVNNELVNKIGLSYGILKADSSSDGIMAISTNLNGGSKSIEDASTLLGIDVKKLNLKSGLALGASLNLLKQQGALDIVSEPSILALNNKESFIYVGEKISMQTSSSVTDGGTQRTNYEREDIGLTLKVKPRVSSESKLTLEINTLLENLKARSVGVSNPDTLKKEINTTAILSNGESVIIGGLIENKNEIVEEKVPVLGDIPVLGGLFKNESNLNRKNNLVIIVTPYIIQKNQDITYIRDKLTKLKALEERYLEESLSDLKVELKSKNENKIEDTQALQEKKFKDFFEQQWFLAYFDKISKKIKENKIKKFKKVHIELTNICNLKCSFCPPKLFPNKIMDLNTFDRLNFELKDITNELAYHIVGDPLVLTNLSEYLNISKKHNLKVNITTTANNISQKHYEALLNPTIKQINFSLNSYNANSHKKSFDEYIEPILEFVKFAQESKHEYFINFRIWNLDEQESAKEFNLKVFDRLNNFFSSNLNIDEIYENKPKNIRVARKIFINFDEYFVWPNLKNEVVSQKGFCYGLNSHFGILSNGTVVPCCLDLDANINLGNIEKSTIKEILQGQRAKEMINGFKNNILKEELCQKCEYRTRFDF